MYLTPIRTLAFDLDGTLAESKAPISNEMSVLLCKLLFTKKVLIMSGGGMEQFEKQLVSKIPCKGLLENLYLMPTSGAEFFIWDKNTEKWTLKYEYRITDEEYVKIKQAIEESFKEANIHIDKIYGEQIENRGTQITISALGQSAPLEVKETWDPDASKRKVIREILLNKIPEFSVRIGGATSIDINKKGIDKAFGLHKFMNYTGFKSSEILYIGDALYTGGNDSVVVETGVRTHAVKNVDDTIQIIKKMINPQ